MVSYVFLTSYRVEGLLKDRFPSCQIITLLLTTYLSQIYGSKLFKNNLFFVVFLYHTCMTMFFKWKHVVYLYIFIYVSVSISALELLLTVDYTSVSSVSS
jgi:hypothetical protein